MKSKTPKQMWLFLVLFINLLAAAYIELKPHTVEGALIYEPQNYGEKHVIPTLIKENEIPLGASKAFSYKLNSSQTYHVYLSGPWVEAIVEENRTDYDIYIYDPFGYLEAYHTEAAALPEHLGTDVGESYNPFFKPKYSGNYTFKIVNDEKESNGSQAATLMFIEHLKTDTWYWNKLYMRGKNELGQPSYFTTWAYEFNTSKPYIEIILDVPNTLDMYEARLFLMASPSERVGSWLSGVPIPSTKFLYGEHSDRYGGYNLDSKGYRGNAFASCEDFGQDMIVSFNSRSDAEKLYHLVFIAEKGGGFLNFIIKTDFTPPELTVLEPFNETLADEEATIKISAMDFDSRLDAISLTYTTDGWETSNQLAMTPAGQQTYEAKIPGQPLGTTISWRIEARDRAWNTAMIDGSFKTRGTSGIFCAPPRKITGGETILISGYLSPPISGEEISLQYILGSMKINRTATTNSTGKFIDQFKPEAAGLWQLWANWTGGESFFPASNTTSFKVEKIPSYLTVFIEDDKVSEGEMVVISGILTPQHGGAPITLSFTDPEGKTSTQEVTTYSEGDFSTTFKPEKVGDWQVKAILEGGPLYESTISNAVTFRVTAKLKIDAGFIKMGAITAGVSVAVITIVYFVMRRRARETEEEGHYLFQ